ncbi:MAG: hypothetical protein FNT15_02090 [Sulfurovum sp.]|nr:MAG: hypothetical protein FNT15_02090 [Sulfurovum sp.]
MARMLFLKLNLGRYLQVQKKMFEEEEATNLLSALDNNLTNYNPFDPLSVASFFDSDFMFNIKDGFDIVIGNPPYLRVQGIDKVESEKYKKLYKSATGSYDLYVIFTERAIKLLGNNGLVNFIMPHKWVNSAFGKGLREVVKDKFFKFISFREYQVFNASTYTSLVWFKNKSEIVKYIGVDKDLNTNSDLKVFLDSITDEKYTVTKNEKLNNDAWTFSDNRVAKVLAKLDEQPLRVKDVFEKIFQGIATSKDSVYILDDCKIIDNLVEGYSKELNKNVLVEKELLKPIIKGDDVKKYQDINSDKFVIFPYYTKFDNEKEKAVLFTENEIKEKFIQGYKYLKECENILRERENGRLENDDYWFRYIYPKSLIEFEQEKIVAPDITMGMNLTIDKNNYCLKNGTYGILIKDKYKNLMKFYLSILNSKLMWWFIQSTGTTLANGYFRFNTNYINPFPLPKIENIEDTKPFEILVDKIMELKKVDSHVKHENDEVRELENKIDEMVYKLYGLSEDEIKVVEGGE